MIAEEKFIIIFSLPASKTEMAFFVHKGQFALRPFEESDGGISGVSCWDSQTEALEYLKSMLAKTPELSKMQSYVRRMWVDPKSKNLTPPNQGE